MECWGTWQPTPQTPLSHNLKVRRQCLYPALCCCCCYHSPDLLVWDPDFHQSIWFKNLSNNNEGRLNWLLQSKLNFSWGWINPHFSNKPQYIQTDMQIYSISHWIRPVFCLHYWIKSVLVKVTSDLSVARSSGNFQLFSFFIYQAFDVIFSFLLEICLFTCGFQDTTLCRFYLPFHWPLSFNFLYWFLLSLPRSASGFES